MSDTRRKFYKKARLTFAIAEMHYRSAMILLQRENEELNDFKPSLLPSAYALYSLSLEMYFKCLYLESGQEAPHTHDLLDLFSGLNEKLKNLIETGYENLCKESDWVKSVKYYYPETDWSIRGVLEQAKNGFVTWRYFHEVTLEDRCKTINFSLYEALPAVRGLILMNYPHWEEINNDEVVGGKSEINIPPT